MNLDKALKIAEPLIKSYEGLKLEAYLDSAGVPTIGYGHTGSAAYMGNKITAGAADTLLRQDMREAARGLRFVKVPLTDNEAAALISFIFNVGAGNFQRSTLLMLLNEGKYNLAAAEFPRWNKAGGLTLSGLIRRREEEKALFLTDLKKKGLAPLL